MENEGHSGVPQTWEPSEGVLPHAISANKGSEAAAGSQPPPRQRKRKVGAIRDEADPRANKKVQDKAYRARVKETQMKTKEERDNLATKNEQLQKEIARLKSDLEKAEKKRSELEAEIRELRLEKQLSEAMAEKKLSDYKNESLSEQLELYKAFWQGSRISTSRCKPRQSCTPCPFQSGKTLHSPNSSSSERLFEKHLTKTDVTRRLTIPATFISCLPVVFSNSTDLHGKLTIEDLNRRLTVQTLGTRQSHFEPQRDRGDLNILVKDSADSMWKFRCSIRRTRTFRLLLDDCADFTLNQLIQSNNQVFFCEVNRTTGANYRSQAAVTGFITIIGLGLVLNCPRASYEDAN